ncbi:hypothetical protein LguiA_004559 [Lonicera macranthoides]
MVGKMSGGRCRRRTMTADGGCGTGKTFTRRGPAARGGHARAGMDLYTQARKALCERSPFDCEDGQKDYGPVPTLPSGLAALLSKNSDSRKRQKKLHSGSEAKGSRPGKGSNIWTETEEYFRELRFSDVEKLYEVSTFGFSPSHKCFSIPFLGNSNAVRVCNGESGTELNKLVDGGGVVKEENGTELGDGGGVSREKNGNELGGGGVVNEENGIELGDGGVVNEENGTELGGGGVVKQKNVTELGGSGVGKEDVKVEGEQFMEVDSTGGNELPQEEDKGCSLLQPKASCSGLEWLLGSRSKIYLTSERPSKKRKLLGRDAGLEKLLVAHPVEGSSSLCHYCSLGDAGDQLNRLIVCSSCGVAVHQRCYGVQDDDAGPWLCSLCKQRNGNQVMDRPCLLCPKTGGALKPVRKRGFGSDDGGSVEFVHLFCCQWIPELYIEDTRTMEPIMNVEGIKETRRKLICYLCKVKCGACVRCSNGTCRTSFHPICARDARHRMEIWGKFGCDDVELRAFCSKHSEVQNDSGTQLVGGRHTGVATDSNITKHKPVLTIVNKPHKLKIGRRNGDKIAVHIEATNTDLDKLGGNVSSEDVLSDTKSNSKLQSECVDAQQPNTDTIENSGEDVTTSDSLNFSLILKKLIDRGKVNVKDVASDIGVSPDFLASKLVDNHLVPDLHCKIVKWLQTHAYIGTLQKSLKLKFKSTIKSKAETGVADDTDAGTLSQSSIPDDVPVKSVPPRRRTKSSIRILKDNKVICSSKASVSDDGKTADEVRSGHLVRDESDDQSKEPIPNSTPKISVDPIVIQDTLARNSPKHEGDLANPSNCSDPDGGQAEAAGTSEQNTMLNSDVANPICPIAMDQIPDVKADALSSSYVHPLIHKKLLDMQNGILSKIGTYEYDGSSRDGEVSTLVASSSSGICCDDQSQNSAEQLVKAKNMGIFELSPVDEVEGELIFYQHRLLSNAVARKSSSDELICKVVKSVPQEIDAVGKQKWDAVLVNQYLSEVREAKKQGRKERRHKEAQAVLAAATAAAAASSRVSSFRKDTLDESAQMENVLKLNLSSGRTGSHSQQMPRAKETLSRFAIGRGSSERNSDCVQSTSDFSKEHPRTCDICRRSETILNPILVCSSCKVAVHLDCYRSVKDSTGPWYCELCEDLSSSRNSGPSAINSWEKPLFVAECGLCGGTVGAFRKSADGQWVHSFCAEWVLDSTFKRGQASPIEGMETVSKGSDVCHICRHKHGVCIKCFYGHCQSTFHPSCARSAGLYMNVKNTGGKLQHKAYCEKHSSVERAKAESQKHGPEDLKGLKQIRVELERLRLLCERIIKREKLKRELVLCTHEILASNREAIALSALARNSFFQPDVSSESATTSLKGYTDGYKSGSEAIQRSDDVTVDSSVAGKRRIKFPVSMDNDQKTDDSSTSQHSAEKPRPRISFSGKKIPRRPSLVASISTSDDGEKQSKCRKLTETFEKELVMTSDQASMRNQRLPKGFVYVPIRCLSNEKETVPDASSEEQLEPDG